MTQRDRQTLPCHAAAQKVRWRLRSAAQSGFTLPIRPASIGPYRPISANLSTKDWQMDWRDVSVRDATSSGVAARQHPFHWPLEPTQLETITTTPARPTITGISDLARSTRQWSTSLCVVRSVAQNDDSAVLRCCGCETAEVQQDLRLAIRLADIADSITLGIWSPSGVSSTTKADDSPVTEEDIAAEQAVQPNSSDGGQLAAAALSPVGPPAARQLLVPTFRPRKPRSPTVSQRCPASTA
jgi:hypothetical protein